VECVVAFWIFFVIAIVAIVQATRSHSAASSRRGVFSGLATRFKGQFTVSAWGGKASLWFRHGDVPVLIRRYNVRASMWRKAAVTQFSVPWPEGRMQLVIVAREPNSSPRSSSRDRELESGQPEFDAAFCTTSRRVELAKRFLTSDVLAYAYRFIWPYKVGFRLRLTGGRLTIETRENIQSARDFEGFIRFCIELFDQSQSSRESGVNFMKSDQAQIVADAKCPVCSEVLVAMVVCKRCRTPHHEDCWTYYGGCSVYGCRETTYEQLLQAEVIPDEESA
jgi:Prokaryotic RING finger family 1